MFALHVFLFASAIIYISRFVIRLFFIFLVFSDNAIKWSELFLSLHSFFVHRKGGVGWINESIKVKLFEHKCNQMNASSIEYKSFSCVFHQKLSWMKSYWSWTIHSNLIFQYIIYPNITVTWNMIEMGELYYINTDYFAHY